MALAAVETKWWTELPSADLVRVILRAQTESSDQTSSATGAILEQISLLPSFDEESAQINTTELNGLIGASLSPEQIEILYGSGLIDAVIPNRE